MADITSAEFLAGFGSDTVMAALFDPLPTGKTPLEVIVSSINAYRIAQEAHNIANPADPIDFAGDVLVGNVVVEDDGSVSESNQVSLSYRKTYGFAQYQPS